MKYRRRGIWAVSLKIALSGLAVNQTSICDPGISLCVINKRTKLEGELKHSFRFRLNKG